MSMNYLIHLKAIVKEGKTDDLLASLKDNGLHEDLLHNTIDEVFKSVLMGDHPRTDYTVCADGTIKSEFDADFSYESSIIHFFKDIAPYLEDDSYMEMFPDNAWSKYIIKNGIIEEYGEQDAIHPCIESAEDLYDMLTGSCPQEFYNEKTGYYVSQYSEDGDVIVYKLSMELARECARFAREHEETWLANLGPGGQIVSEDDAVEFLDGILEEGTEEDWILASPVADMFALKTEK